MQEWHKSAKASAQRVACKREVERQLEPAELVVGCIEEPVLHNVVNARRGHTNEGHDIHTLSPLPMIFTAMAAIGGREHILQANTTRRVGLQRHEVGGANPPSSTAAKL